MTEQFGSLLDGRLLPGVIDFGEDFGDHRWSSATNGLGDAQEKHRGDHQTTAQDARPVDTHAEQQCVPDERQHDGHGARHGHDARLLVLEGQCHEQLVANAAEADRHQPRPRRPAARHGEAVDGVECRERCHRGEQWKPKDDHVHWCLLQLAQHYHAEGGAHRRHNRQDDARVVDLDRVLRVEVLQYELWLRHKHHADQRQETGEYLQDCDHLAENEVGQDEHKHWRGELNGARVGERNQPIGHVDADGGDATEDGTQGDVESMASDAEEGQAVDGDGREVKDYLKYWSVMMLIRLKI